MTIAKVRKRPECPSLDGWIKGCAAFAQWSTAGRAWCLLAWTLALYRQLEREEVVGSESLKKPDRRSELRSRVY